MSGEDMASAVPAPGYQPTLEIWTDTAFVRRFWSMVYQARDPDDCWPWNGSGVRGRGRISIAGRMHISSRIAKILTDKRWPPEGQLACHTCDNPRCCNPGHIWWGTAADNARDAAAKGRLSDRSAVCRNGHAKTGFDRCPECARIRKTEWQRNRRKELSNG